MNSELTRRPGTVFGPDQIATLTEAYRAALSSIGEADIRSQVSGHELRRRIASLIIDEAAHGQLDPKRLAEKALETMKA